MKRDAVDWNKLEKLRRPRCDCLDHYIIIILRSIIGIIRLPERQGSILMEYYVGSGIARTLLSVLMLIM